MTSCEKTVFMICIRHSQLLEYPNFTLDCPQGKPYEKNLVGDATSSTKLQYQITLLHSNYCGVEVVE